MKMRFTAAMNLIVSLAAVHVCLVSESLALMVGPARPPGEGIDDE